jgi:CubicO group peptidase (beta-lactamase class C family)
MVVWNSERNAIMRNEQQLSSADHIANRLEKLWLNSGLNHLDVIAGDKLATRVRFSGRGKTGDGKAACDTTDRLFLVASLTKPVVATLAIQSACEGLLCFSDRVSQFIPAFARGPLRRIQVRHLLTHTSGLPDMLPENEALRAAHAPTEEFVHGTAEVTPEFAAGTHSRYSSMGFAVLGRILETVFDNPLRCVLQQRLFQPLEMSNTFLGLPDDLAAELLPQVLPSELPRWQPAAVDWNWNSRYWRQLGAPWGGLITTADDLAKLSVALLQESSSGRDEGLLRPVAMRMAFENQLACYGDITASHRQTRGWGFGWRLNWPDHAACFGDFLPATAAGHWGATGTLWWIDPASGNWAVLLSTTPYEESRSTLQRCSNIIAAECLP